MIQKYGINPKLIRVLTGQDLASIPDRPTASRLPGLYVAKAAAAMNQLQTGLVSNIIRLQCTKCGHSGDYDLRTVAVDITKPEDVWLDQIQVAGYFRCKHCNAAGQWKFSDTSRAELQLRAMAGIAADALTGGNWQSDLPPRFVCGKIVVDGDFMPKWGTDAEEHFLEKLSRSPEEAYYWDRLGNLYEKSGRADLALAVYERAVQLDARMMESLYSLGTILHTIGDLEVAAAFHRQVLCVAHDYHRMPAVQQRLMLVSSMEELLSIHHATDQTVPFLPTPEEIERFYGDGSYASVADAIIVLRAELESDQDNEEAWLSLAEAYMGKRREELPPTDRYFGVPSRSRRQRTAYPVAAVNKQAPRKKKNKRMKRK